MRQTLSEVLERHMDRVWFVIRCFYYYYFFFFTFLQFFYALVWLLFRLH